LGAVRPGLLALGLLLVAWVTCSPKRRLLGDPIIRWQLVYLGVALAGLIVIVNHRAWFNMTTAYLEYLFAFSIALPTVMQQENYTNGLIRLFVASFAFLAFWVVAHGGIGTAGWMMDENDAAAVLIVGACLGYALWSHSVDKRQKGMGALLGAACIIGVVATNSRGGFLGLAAAILAMAIFSRAILRASVAVVIGCALALLLVPDRYLSEMKTINDPSDRTRAARIYSWHRAWDMFLANPVIGVGAGNYAWTVNLYEGSKEAEIQRGGMRSLGGRAAHSLPFTLLSEMGIVGTLGFVSAAGVAFRRAWRISRATPESGGSPTRRMLAAWIGTGLIGHLVAAVFISVLWYPMIWLLIALGIVLGPVDADTDERMSARLRSAGAVSARRA
jgi:hypothetical protein